MSRKSAGAVLIFCVMALAASMAVTESCQHPQSNVAAGDPTKKKFVDISNQHLVDTAVSLLRSGYIVLRMGLGADSRLLAQMNRKDKSYSHCGIVMVENGYPFVYHSIGGENNPDERLRRDSAKFFFSPVYNTAIAVVQYDLDSIKIAELGKVVRAYYKQRPKFDMKFDLRTDDKLYCSEFVSKALNKAAHDTAYIGTTSVAGMRFVGIDNLFVTPHAHIIWQTVFK